MKSITQNRNVADALAAAAYIVRGPVWTLTSLKFQGALPHEIARVADRFAEYELDDRMSHDPQLTALWKRHHRICSRYGADHADRIPDEKARKRAETIEVLENQRITEIKAEILKEYGCDSLSLILLSDRGLYGSLVSCERVAA